MKIVTVSTIKIACHFIAKGDKKREANVALYDNVIYEYDIPYFSDGEKGHLFDVYRPKNAKSKGIIVDIHGGAFVYSYKENNKAYASYLANQGYTVFNINYRLTGKKGLDQKTQLEDCLSFVTFLKNNYKNYGLNDLDNFIITGDSAGGYLAILLTQAINHKIVGDKFGYKHDNLKVKKLIVSSTLYDYFEAYGFLKKYLTKKAVCYIGGDHFGDDEFVKAINPREYISLGLPPIFMSTSKHDFLNKETFTLAEDCKRYGIVHKLYFEDNNNKKVNHIFNVAGMPDEPALSCTKESVRFLENN